MNPSNLARNVTRPSRQSRWSTEASFFDRVANEKSNQHLQLDPLTVRRYAMPSLRRRFHPEYRFRVLGSLSGKDVLDAGCGDGSNSVLLAKLGARVTGVDVSRASVELAKKRAAVNGLEASTRFTCSPLETANLPPNSFDVIWADCILHHVIPELEAVLRSFRAWAKPGATVILSEPINLNPALRKLRLAMPIRTHHTPGERPLESPEIRIIRQHFPTLRIRHFAMFGRLSRFILSRQNYERSALGRRIIANSIALVDYGLLSLPYIRNSAGIAVMSAIATK